MVIVLDTFPTSTTGKRLGTTASVADDCQRWINQCEAAGHRILVPAISYYEVLREFEMRQAASQVIRLKTFCLVPRRFIALTTRHLETAAQLWGQSRRAGRPTSDPHALDGDVILAAQVMSLRIPASGVIVATTNPDHLSRFVRADLWENVIP